MQKVKGKKVDKGNKNFQPSNLEFTSINVDNKAHNVFHPEQELNLILDIIIYTFNRS